jgi:hypothetical protein
MKFSFTLKCLRSAIVLAALLACRQAHAQSDEISRAIEYCRHFPLTYAFNDEHTVLCLDGTIPQNADLAFVQELKEHGTFVMRSGGGYPSEAMLLSNMLRAKDARVVLYDYCLSACANFVLIANRTYVAKDTIVAWHGSNVPKTSLTDCQGSGLEQLRRDYVTHYGESAKDFPDQLCQLDALLRTFFKERGIDDEHTRMPPTHHTLKMVRLIASEKGESDHGGVYWMWNPKNYGDHFKSIVVFEAYPQSQDEVDSLARRLKLGAARFVFDP